MFTSFFFGGKGGAPPPVNPNGTGGTALDAQINGISGYDSAHVGAAGSLSQNFVLQQQLLMPAPLKDVARVAENHPNVAARLYALDEIVRRSHATVDTAVGAMWGMTPPESQGTAETKHEDETPRAVLDRLALRLCVDTAGVHGLSGCMGGTTTVHERIMSYRSHLSAHVRVQVEDKVLSIFLSSQSPSVLRILTERAASPNRTEATYVYLQSMGPDALETLVLWQRPKEQKHILSVLSKLSRSSLNSAAKKREMMFVLRAVTKWPHDSFYEPTLALVRNMLESDSEPNLLSLPLHGLLSFRQPHLFSRSIECLQLWMKRQPFKLPDRWGQGTALDKVAQSLPSEPACAELLLSAMERGSVTHRALKFLLTMDKMPQAARFAVCIGADRRAEPSKQSPLVLLQQGNARDMLGLIFQYARGDIQTRTLALLALPSQRNAIFSTCADTASVGTALQALCEWANTANMGQATIKARTDTVLARLEDVVKCCDCHNSSTVLPIALDVLEALPGSPTVPTAAMVEVISRNASDWNMHVREPAIRALQRLKLPLPA